MPRKALDRSAAVRNVLRGLLVANVAVVIAKAAVGTVAGSLAVLGDAIHSSVDAIYNVLGLIVPMTPVEEMIWSKAFIQERERFDGGDVLHLLRETGPSLDWPRLLMRFGDYWRVLLSHLILFGFVYPDKRQNIPEWVTEELIRRLTVSRPNLQSDVCYGTLLSREQYLHDVGQWKYRDARQEPEGAMTTEQIEIWTAAISGETKR